MYINREYSQCLICHLQEYSNQINSVLASIPRNSEMINIIASLITNNLNVSFIELKESNYTKNRYPAKHYPYIKNDLISTSNNPDNPLNTIYVSIHENIAIDAMYLKNISIANTDILNRFNLLFKSNIESAGYTGEYYIQSIPKIVDNNINIVSNVFSDIYIHDNQLSAIYGSEFHYLNKIKIPTLKILRHYTDYTGINIPYHTVDTDRINRYYQ